MITTADTPAGTRRRLTRVHQGRVLAGVCQGAGLYFDVDPVIFRVVLAVLTVFGGAGVVIYLLAWILIPAEGSRPSRLEQWVARGHRETRRDLLLLVLAVILVIVLANAHVFAHRIGAAVVAAAAALLITDLVARRRGRALFDRRAAPVYYGPEPAPAGYAENEAFAVPVPVAVEPRDRAWLGWLTFGTLLVAAGVLSVVASSGAAHPQPADAFALLVAIAGLGLVVGALAGRARAMIPVGALLVIALGVTNALPRDLTWTAGKRSWAPVAADLAPSYVLGAGRADLNLSGLGPQATATIDARIGAGRLTVYVPRGSGVVVDAHVSAGRILVFGHEQDGTGVTEHQVVAPAGPRDGTLTLHLDGGFGNLEVRDAAA
jgi:phage shock protein PspC (stress-responsive transcriptional regulator)